MELGRGTRVGALRLNCRVQPLGSPAAPCPPFAGLSRFLSPKLAAGGASRRNLRPQAARPPRPAKLRGRCRGCLLRGGAAVVAARREEPSAWEDTVRGPLGRTAASPEGVGGGPQGGSGLRAPSPRGRAWPDPCALGSLGPLAGRLPEGPAWAQPLPAVHCRRSVGEDLVPGRPPAISPGRGKGPPCWREGVPACSWGDAQAGGGQLRPRQLHLLEGWGRYPRLPAIIPDGPGPGVHATRGA